MSPQTQLAERIRDRTVAAPTTEYVHQWANAILAQMADIEPGSEKISPYKNPSSISWIASAKGRNSVVKIFIKHHHEEKMFEREVKALTMLGATNSSMKEEAFPKILGADHELRLMAISWIDGQAIGPVLRNSVHRLGNKVALDIGKAAAYSVGTWLRDFENATTVKNSRYPSEEICGRITELLNLISTDTILSESELATIQSISDQLGGAVKPRYKAALAHCDFWFDHILLSAGGTVAVLDYGRAKYSPCGRDAIEFILRLQDFCSGNPFVSRKKVALLETSFLTGYGALDFAEPGLRLFAIMRRLEQLGGLVEQNPTRLVDKVVLQHRKISIRRWIRRNLVRSAFAP